LQHPWRWPKSLSPLPKKGRATPPNPRTNLQDLNAREQALARKEAELRDLEAQVDEKLTRLRELEIQMQSLIDSAGSIQDEKMAHLIDVYSNMKPKQAAVVLQTLEEPIAVRILAGMSGRKAGEILSSVRADRAAELSAALTRLQTGDNGN
jgi:flagellar motility protein MotE (MotC chaperone)